MLNPPVEIVVRHADGRTYSVIPPEHDVLDMVWDRKMVETPNGDHYARMEPGPEIELTIRFRRRD